MLPTELISQLLEKRERMGQKSEVVILSDEAWEDLAAELVEVESDGEQQRTQAQAFLDELSSRFDVPVRTLQPEPRRELREGDTVFGKRLVRHHVPGYIIGVG
jgi:hypothetical protein